MPLIDHRSFAQGRLTARKKRWRHPLIYMTGGLVAAFVLVNAAMAVAYNGRVLPRFSLGSVPVGGIRYAALEERLRGKILPEQIGLQKGSDRRTVAPADMGASVDIAGSIDALQAARPRLPVFSLFVQHKVPARVAVDAQKYTAAAEGLKPAFTKEPLMQRVVFDGSKFVVAPEEAGYRLDVDGLRRELAAGLRAGKTSMTVPTSAWHPERTGTDLNAEIQKLQKKLSLRTTISYNGQEARPSAKDIGGWYVTERDSMKLSPEKIGAYIDRVAPGAANRSDLISAVQYVVSKDQSAGLVASPRGSPLRTYCTASRGVGGADLGDLTGKLAATYADPRGWNAGGRMAFQHVESGCEFTVWISSPGQMTSFGEICDDYYNCQVGANVIVNNDRWNKATDPWNATGASVEDYRTLVINHETGHRLGFYDNNTCPAPGGPAPVMMQQSIDLHGCVFNRFPTAAELGELRSRNGL